MPENLMKICLDKAFQTNVPKNKRQIIISKIAEWKMLDKPFRTFVYLAIDEVEAPAVDEDENTPSRKKTVGRRNRRRTPAATPHTSHNAAHQHAKQ